MHSNDKRKNFLDANRRWTLEILSDKEHAHEVMERNSAL